MKTPAQIIERLTEWADETRDRHVAALVKFNERAEKSYRSAVEWSALEVVATERAARIAVDILDMVSDEGRLQAAETGEGDETVEETIIRWVKRAAEQLEKGAVIEGLRGDNQSSSGIHDAVTRTIAKTDYDIAYTLSLIVGGR